MLLQIPSVLTLEELQSLRASLAEAAFEDGATTAGHVARQVKRNLQVPQISDASKKCAAVVIEALRRNSVFYSAVLPHRIHGPLFNRYDGEMTYGDHVDNAVMNNGSIRSDVAATLFVSAPEHYDGGELIVQDSYGGHSIKLAAGNLIVYPAGSVHRVQPVTRGTRLAAVLWIQSLVRDEVQRRLLLELDVAIGALRKSAAAEAQLGQLTAVYNNLMRMWAQT